MPHLALLLASLLAGPPDGFTPVEPAGWVRDVTRMAFITPGQVDEAARAGVQVVHANVVWPYYPLRRDGGGLSPADAERLKEFVEACHAKGIKAILGLPPFPPVALVKDHPDWRVHPDDSGATLKVEPRDDDLGTRVGCNLGPWGDYLIDLLVELLVDYRLDGYSFDGNYHPALCFCPACKAAYRRDRGSDLPAKVDLDDLAYRRYLVWRGERLEDHYRHMQHRLKGANRDAALITWTVNAGRYGHLLSAPRSMTTRMNLLIDLPMQEWWLDETNQGASVAPTFGLAYLRGIVGATRPVASEPYLMSRGNPYGTDSFPKHERLARALLATSQGNLAPQSFGWPGHGPGTAAVFRSVGERERWAVGLKPLRWAALLVSEQTRQFVAYKDVAGRYLPHVFGAYRAGVEEHLPVEVVNDWDLDPARLAGYRVLFLPAAAALSDAQAGAVRAFVRGGGGLVASAESSLHDELGRPRADFALADLFGVSYRGTPAAPAGRAEIDVNFAKAAGEAYWKDRVGVARLSWGDHPLTRDPRLDDLVPGRSAAFKGPRVVVSEPAEAGWVVARAVPEGGQAPGAPAVVAREFGKGRVVYLAAGLDAALWDYAYPYQRRLLARALAWAAGAAPAVAVEAPMAVQATYFTQGDGRTVVHLFNGIDTAAHHGRPGTDVPLREESVPVHGVRVRFHGDGPTRFRVEPGGRTLTPRREGDGVAVDLPPLEIHAVLVADDPPGGP